MRIKVSDYIADFFAEKGINQVFCVVGGGAMHLNDSFGHHPKIKCIYNHHEQASAIAAEGFSRINNIPAICCVTSGPGAINALNGVVGAYQDSIPMIVISGQAKREMTIRYTHSSVRTLGNQEFDIVSALSKMTKFAEMVMDASEIRYLLEKSLFLAVTGRPGPCWLDVPLDIQGSFVETDDLRGFDPKEVNEVYEDVSILDDIAKKIMSSKRPVLYAGNGIRLSGAKDILIQVSKRANIPIVTCWDSIDLIETTSDMYVGRAGTMGDRAGNFAVQNSDLLICVGTRLNIYQVGYNKNTWAREAFVIEVDIDRNELCKPTTRIDLPICMDAKVFLEGVLNRTNYCERIEWSEKCRNWKERYPVVQEKHIHANGLVNVYSFIGKLSKMIGDGSVTVVANGSASVVGSQAYYIGKDSRFIMNCGLSSMGYDLPAAIGACVGNNCKSVVCIAGDGSIQMNIQELQTIVTNKLPIKIFIINNGGYHQIRLTQNNIFHNGLIGVGPESGDLGFPDFEKLSYAYGIPYHRISENKMLDEDLKKVLDEKGYCICEVICSIDQMFEPKSATKRLEDGTLFSPPLEDLAPFLSREELKENMIIPMVEEMQ